ncbi:hypothetical protein AB0M87_29975 [Streptomyces sp. NPDC051320]|uniref:hypothetical protein n=1 Tax=Streptomyces sp. NPDC051320 TaxID=3154644 RepID=UPI00342B3BA5
MAITDDLRKTLTDPTPLYFAAGTADLAVQQARKVPALIEKLQAEAPARIDAVRNTDPKSVSDKVTLQAKEAQATVTAKVTEVFDSFDSDLKKFGENAQDLALRGVGIAAEYAVKAREAYEKVAERGEQTVKHWRGEASEEIVDFAVAVEPEPVRKPVPKPTSVAKPAPKTEVKSGPTSGTAAAPKTGSKSEPKSANKAAPKVVKADSKPSAASRKPVGPRKPTTTSATAATSPTSATAKKATPPAGK